MRRHFLTLGDRQLHLRWAGEGPPVVLLHPSPLSSTAVLPVATALARHCRVYALDTPGYGLSDAPARQPASLDDYLPDLSAALDALGLDRVCLYGCATGAQIAIEYARRRPDRVELLVLDTSRAHSGGRVRTDRPRLLPERAPGEGRASPRDTVAHGA